MGKSSYTSFEDLDCWKTCRRLRLFVAKEIIPLLPKEERFGLKDQIIRAARSTTANIAEGYGRFHYMDNAKFCSNSRGSCWEVLDHLITAHDEGLISDEMLKKGRELVNTAVKLVNGYMNYLKRAGNKPTVREKPEEYLTTNFKMGFCLGPGSFGGSDEYAYIDDIEIIMHDIQVDTVIFNSNEITADEQQLQENNDRAETTGTWSYSCYYDATNLVEQLIDDEELGTNGSGTYTLGHVISERPGYPAYTFEVYPTSEETGYPLGIPATGTTMRDQYTYAGWSLIIIYVSPETTGHQLYLYDDLTFVGSGDDLELPITGFITPEEPEGSRLTCFVGEGDFRYTGDYIEINGNRLSDAVNPSTNVWNSYSNALDDPNQEGIDLDTFNVSNYIDPGDTSATVLLGSNTEIYNSVYIILSFRSITDIGGTVTYLIAE